MRIPLALAGMREMVLMTLVLGGLAALCAYGAIGLGWVWCWPIVAILAIVWGWSISFFRDPARPIPSEPGLMVSPADGKIVETARIDDYEGIAGAADRISIFLSVFDVHINRSPCSGVVRSVTYKPGQFLDARDPDSGRYNESNTIVIEPDGPDKGPVVVRQIAGLVARRIVCYVKVGDRLERGQRVGLIKFGSRTELIYPASDDYDFAVQVGDRTKGAMTVMARRKSRSTAGSNDQSLETAKV